MAKVGRQKSFSVAEVAEAVLQSDGEEEVGEGGEREKEDVVKTWLSSFPAEAGFNLSLFVDLGSAILRPVIAQCTSNDQSPERSRVTSLLSSPTISAASILREEAHLWLERIHSRLAGRVAVRRPYESRINRSIPHAVFAASKRVLIHSLDQEFKESKCIMRANRKGEVISFTSLCSVQRFFSLLTGLNIGEVKKYFQRRLQGHRKGHNTKLLVFPEKDFAFVYRLRAGQLEICFHYGEWNAYGFPQHNCML